MGVFSYPLSIAATDEGPYQEFSALVDTGSLLTWVPASALLRIGLRPSGKRQFYTADSRVIDRGICRAWVRLDSQREGALIVFGEESDQVLLGAHTLEGLDLAVDPVNKRLMPMPTIPAVSPVEPSR